MKQELLNNDSFGELVFFLLDEDGVDAAAEAIGCNGEGLGCAMG